MKTVTTREFYHTPALIKTLRPGQSLAVTDNGVPTFMVTKAGRRPIKTVADHEKEAAEICSPDRPKVNLTEMMKQLKK